MLGQKSPKRNYVGYVLWRGIVKESDVSESTRELLEGHFTLLVLQREYMIWCVLQLPESPGLASRISLRCLTSHLCHCFSTLPSGCPLPSHLPVLAS